MKMPSAMITTAMIPSRNNRLKIAHPMKMTAATIKIQPSVSTRALLCSDG